MVPAGPFAHIITQLEVERLLPVSYYGPDERLHHDLKLLFHVLNEMLDEVDG